MKYCAIYYIQYQLNILYIIHSYTLSIKFSLSKNMHLHFFKIFNIENNNKNDINAIICETFKYSNTLCA